MLQKSTIYTECVERHFVKLHTQNKKLPDVSITSFQDKKKKLRQQQGQQQQTKTGGEFSRADVITSGGEARHHNLSNLKARHKAKQISTIQTGGPPTSGGGQKQTVNKKTKTKRIPPCEVVRPEGRSHSGEAPPRSSMAMLREACV